MSIILSGDNGVTFPNSTVQASAGSVLQVVNATYATETSTSSSTFADTGLTASITPKFSTSKILVLVSINGCRKTSSDTYGQFRLVRNSTEIVRIETTAGAIGGAGQTAWGSTSTNYSDSPATTSSTTYKVQFLSQNNTAAVIICNSTASIPAVSTITLMEIAA